MELCKPGADIILKEEQWLTECCEDSDEVIEGTLSKSLVDNWVMGWGGSLTWTAKWTWTESIKTVAVLSYLWRFIISEMGGDRDGNQPLNTLLAAMVDFLLWEWKNSTNSTLGNTEASANMSGTGTQKFIEGTDRGLRTNSVSTEDWHHGLRLLEYVAGNTMLFCPVWGKQKMTAGVKMFLRAVVTWGVEMGRLKGPEWRHDWQSQISWKRQDDVTQPRTF